MIDPTKITNFKLSDYGLQENLLFWIAVAGKNAKTISKRLDSVLTECSDISGKSMPFESISEVYDLASILKENGIGCYNLKARGMIAAAESNLDLRNCSADDLENIPGIGMKTSRCFIIHTRRNARVAGLDTHVLKFLRSKGVDAPKQTPSSKKKYIDLENKFLEFADEVDLPVAEYDLAIWNKYSVK